MEKFAIAGLVGLARLGMLCAKTPEALALVDEVAEMDDCQDEIPDGFMEAILDGAIRTDAFWKEGREGFLFRLVSLYKEEEA